MKYKKIITALLCIAVISALSGCSSETSSESENLPVGSVVNTITLENISPSETIYAMVTEINGGELNLSIVNMNTPQTPSGENQGNPPAESQTDINFNPGQQIPVPQGGNDGDSQNIPQMPESAENTNPPEMPDGSSGNALSPEGFSNNADMETPPAKPDGTDANPSDTMPQGSDIKPDTPSDFSEMPAGFSDGYFETGESCVLTVNDESVLSGMTLDDITNGSILRIVFDENGLISEISAA